MNQSVELTWLPSWHAYVVRRGARILGMIVCRPPLPFRVTAVFA